jgi:glycerol kinase
LFGVPSAILPEVRDCSGDFGLTKPGLFGRQIPIGGIAGDQQSALVGQACFEPGMAKATYGTGCFMLLHTGASAVDAGHGLLTTPAYRLKGEIAYAVEGSIFIAGAALNWLRDGLGIISDVSESDALARSVPDGHGIHMVPAFVGLGAPHWDPDARAAIFGLTLNATGAHLVRAALEAVGFQTADLIKAMTSAGSSAGRTLRVDGGMAANDWLCQFVADITGIRVERPQTLETTALGAAFLAGLSAGIWSGTADLSKTWSASGEFVSTMESDRREQLLAGWRAAVGHTRTRGSVRLDT